MESEYTKLYYDNIQNEFMKILKTLKSADPKRSICWSGFSPLYEL